MADNKSGKNFLNNDTLQSDTLNLLTISNGISAAKTFNDLVLVITEKVQSLFGFSHVHLCVVEDHKAVYSLFSPVVSTNVKLLELGVDRVLIDTISSPALPQIVRFDQLDGQFYKNIKEHSFKQILPEEALLAKLTYGGNFYGWWTLFFEDCQTLANAPTNIFAGIAEQLAVAIANISANEMIARREAEKELLLSLSKDIAAVRNRCDLLSVLTQRVKGITDFSHVSIAKVDMATRTMWPTMFDPESNSKNDREYNSLHTAILPVDDGYMDRTILSENPVVFDLSVIDHGQSLPAYFQINYKNGIQQAVSVKLMRYQQVIGLWTLFFKSKQQWNNAALGLIQGVADLLSIAISNIEANETIEQRELEKSRLLDFSTAMASIQGKSELSRLMSRHIKELCSAVDYCLCWKSENKELYAPYLWETPVLAPESAEANRLLNVINPVTDRIFSRLQMMGDLIVFDMTEECSHPECPEYMHIIKRNGIMRLIGFPLYVGQEMTGIFFSNFDDMLLNEANLVKSLCAQLALAVSNLIATEKVTNQLTEISKYKEQLEEEKIYLKEELKSSNNYTDIVGQSPEINKVFQLVSQVSHSDSTVLILGETGTGKELIARAIHQNSPRASKLMVKLNCAALPPNLIESELFGHEKGSFTGAIDRRVGKFELADNGTLFLDEIGEIPLELQSKLLRVLQEKEVERVGGKTIIKVDVRIVAATNRNLEVEVAEGRFRSDLYYRLNIFPISLPPLRDRKEDISLLAAHFVQRFAKKAGKNITNISNKVINELLRYSWPGNIRELEHMMERSVLITVGTSIREVVLPTSSPKVRELAANDQHVKTLDENERDYIMKVLKQCQGRIGGLNGAAKLLGVPATTLSSKIKRLGIKRKFNF